MCNCCNVSICMFLPGISLAVILSCYNVFKQLTSSNPEVKSKLLQIKSYSNDLQRNSFWRSFSEVFKQRYMLFLTFYSIHNPEARFTNQRSHCYQRNRELPSFPKSSVFARQWYSQIVKWSNNRHYEGEGRQTIIAALNRAVVERTFQSKEQTD